MKQLKTMLTAMLLLCCATMSAHSFEVGGIYYNILSGEEVEVTYRGSSYNNYSDRYSDNVTIPETVTYNGTTFNVTAIGSNAFYYCSNLINVKMPNSITNIGNNSFYFCENLASIDMPKALTTIGDCAFYNCNSLESVEIPASVTTIGDAAFYNCWSLESIEIPANAAIAYNSFYGCSSLNKIMSYVPAENLFEIGWMTFYPADKSSCTLYVPKGTKEAYENTVGWNEFTNIEEFNGKCGKNAIWKYDEETSTLTVQGEEAMYDYNHYTSNEEEWSPWKDCNINELIIEEGITSIGNCAFTSCNYINISIPNTVTVIGHSAFAGTTFNNFSFPAYLTTIGERAFSDCLNFNYDDYGALTIPASVTSIGVGAFEGCESIVKLIVNEENPVYDSRENCNAIIETATNKLIAGCRNSVVPSTVTAIEDYAFCGHRQLYNITFPNSVTTVGSNVFYGCEFLYSISIGSGVSSIGINNFYGCGYLTSIVVDKNNPVYDSRGNCNAIIETATNKLVAGCVSTEIPVSITSIGESAFNNCYTLKNIAIPANVTYIGKNAFSCWQLANITSFIPADKLFAIDSYVFSDVNKNTCILYVPAGAKETYAATEGWNEFTNIVELDSKYDRICGTSAFWDYNEETGTLTISGEGAMYNYRNFQTPWKKYNGDIKQIEIKSGITSVGDYAISACIKATSISIPNTVTKIGDHGIYQLYDLQSLIIPNSITEVGEFAFATCTSIKEIHIPASLTSIDTSAFGGCNSLETITVDSNNPCYNSNNNCNAIIETATNALIVGCKNTVIPDNVTKIGKQAFTQFGIGPVATGGPTSITIPAGVTEIGDYAFSQCRKLETIISHIPADRLFTPGYLAFNDLHPNCTLYVPAGAKETYAATEGWNEFTNIVEMIENPFELTVSAAGYATLYLDYNAEIPYGVEAYTASTVEGNSLKMQQVTGTLPANTAVIVKAKQGSYTFEQSFEETEAIENNLLRGSVEDEYITPEKGAKYYVLAMKDGVVGMYEDALTGGTFKNNANKAYLVLSNKNLGIYDEEVNTQNPGVQLSNSYYFDFGTTAIDPVVTGSEENIYYDLSGRRVENPTRGIYILSGKKVFVK